MKSLKYTFLFKGLLFDAIGMTTMFVPIVGPFLDILWAPYAASVMVKMYPNKEGKVASVIVFIEELLPYTDVLPTFTLMWLYSFVWKKEAVHPEAETIEVEAETL